jgi:hypothetical protein
MLTFILSTINNWRKGKLRERERRRLAALLSKPCLETMEERIVPVTHQFSWVGTAAAWTPGYAHLGNVATSWENPANWRDIQTALQATTLPQQADLVQFGSDDIGRCIMNANEDIGNIDFVSQGAAPSLEILAGKKLEVHNDLANQGDDGLGNFNESLLAGGIQPPGTIQIDSGAAVHTGGQIEFHGGNTVWNAVTVSTNTSTFKGDIFVDGGGTLHVGKTIAPWNANSGISDSAHIWVGYTPTLTGGNYTPDTSDAAMYVDTFDTGKNFQLANNADIWLAKGTGTQGKLILDADESMAHFSNGNIVDLTGNSQVYVDGELDRFEAAGDTNAQALNVNVLVEGQGLLWVHNSGNLIVNGSGVGSYSLTMTGGATEVGGFTSSATLSVGSGAHQGYHQTGGTLWYGVGGAGYTAYIHGTGLIEGGTVAALGTSSTQYGDLYLDDGNWTVKGSTIMKFHINGASSGTNDQIVIGAGDTLTIGDSSTQNNVVISTYIWNHYPVGGDQYTLLNSGGPGAAVTILDSIALTIIVDSTSPYSASWGDYNSTWGTNLVLTEQ